MIDFALYSIVTTGHNLESPVVCHFTNKTAAREYAREAMARGFSVSWEADGYCLNKTADRALDFLAVMSREYQTL